MANDWSKHPFPPNRHVHFSPLRRVQQRKDSDGVAHQILVQTEEMSCGPAAVAILISLCRHQPLGTAADMRLKTVAARFAGSMAEQDEKWKSQGPNSGHQGSYLANIENVLVHEHIPIAASWHRWQEKSSTAVVAQGRVHHSPALLLWGWYEQSQRVGGHFTVAARVTRAGKVVILDPWDGSLAEIAAGALYKGSGMLDAAIYTG